MDRPQIRWSCTDVAQNLADSPQDIDSETEAADCALLGVALLGEGLVEGRRQ